MPLAYLSCPNCDAPVHQSRVSCAQCKKKMPAQNEIFVFGSNLAGIHGRGSAYHARKYYGALQSVGQGRMGMAYAIPTKDRVLRVLPLDIITVHVKKFIEYAGQHTELVFNVVAIGCGLAGYKPKDIAPMFRGISTNVHLPLEFKEVLR